MSTKKLKIVEARLHSITHNGSAIGRTEDGLVVFVQGAVPGDLVKVGLSRKRKGVWNGIALEILEKSNYRTEPICKHFGVCGGCSWQNLTYSKQTELKEQIVIDAMRRIAKLETTIFESILACRQEYYYRNKLEFTFSSRRWLLAEEISNEEDFKDKNALGFHRPGTFDKIVDIESCHLQVDINNQIRNALKNYAKEQDISFYDIRNHTGLLRNLIIKTNEKNQVLLVLSLSEYNKNVIDGIFDYLHKNFDSICSAYYAINTKKNDSWFDLNCIKVFGDEWLTTRLNHVSFNIGPKSFFQTNREQAESLYSLVEEYAELQGHEIVYDLYCGVGSIGIYLARKAQRIIGIEEIPEAIEDAIINAKLNKLTNFTFLTGDVLKILTEELILEHGIPDVMIVDPPRVGLHPEVIAQILKFAPKRLVYVSCNPSTAARDLVLLQEEYVITKVRPVDMFPMTNHIEMIAQLIRK